MGESASLTYIVNVSHKAKIFFLPPLNLRPSWA